MLKLIFKSILFSLCVMNMGCGGYDFTNRIAKQGNLSVINKIDKLRIGMSKSEIRQIMGSSLISPLFDNNRWDFTDTVKYPNKKTQIHSASLYFSNSRLVKIDKTR